MDGRALCSIAQLHQSQKSWCASWVGKHLACETTLCVLQCADPYMYFRRVNAPISGERKSSSPRREGTVLGGERKGGIVYHRRRMLHAARASQQEGGTSLNLLPWATACSSSLFGSSRRPDPAGMWASAGDAACQDYRMLAAHLLLCYAVKQKTREWDFFLFVSFFYFSRLPSLQLIFLPCFR